jgi:alkanesulfonate monooxygenase SsuD/methylene tetrahydromethanopterin reductase-like flavin-dependent oxidoreductase (luciferase family)
VWTPDELLWRRPESPPQGFWEGIAMAGAIAAVTSRIKVGTWVVAALHRNPGITAKAVETLDEISGGRFVFGRTVPGAG